MFREEYMRQVLIIALIAIVAMLCAANSGCQGWDYERYEFNAATQKMELVVRARGRSQFMESNVDHLHVEVDGDKRYMSIGKVSFDPDDEATKAFVEGIVSGAISRVLP